jgi:hypothetical protein
MDVAGFCSQANVVVVAGKGGVGKTTVASTLATVAAQAGLNVVLVGLDDSSAIPSLFGVTHTLGYDDETLEVPGLGAADGSIRARIITSDAALLEYLVAHGLRRVAKRLVANGALDVIATAIPGIREILVLGKVRQLEQAGAADLIIVDAPATGHALTFLTSSRGLLDAARGGPLRSQAEAVVEFLSDPKRCSVLLVTILEETPINELIEAAYALEDAVGVKLGPVVVNGRLPSHPMLGVDPTEAARAVGVEVTIEVADELAAAARFELAREQLQGEQLGRLARELALPRLSMPLLYRAVLGPDDLADLAAALAASIEAL